MQINTKLKFPRRECLVMQIKADAFWKLLESPGLRAKLRTRTSSSERRHAIELKAGSLRTADAFVLVHLWAVAVLVRALCRLIWVVVAYLLVLLLLFNAKMIRANKSGHAATPGHRYETNFKIQITFIKLEWHLSWYWYYWY